VTDPFQALIDKHRARMRHLAEVMERDGRLQYALWASRPVSVSVAVHRFAYRAAPLPIFAAAKRSCKLPLTSD
jgi:hypothetical protein